MTRLCGNIGLLAHVRCVGAGFLRASVTSQSRGPTWMRPETGPYLIGEAGALLRTAPLSPDCGRSLHLLQSRPFYTFLPWIRNQGMAYACY